MNISSQPIITSEIRFHRFCHIYAIGAITFEVIFAGYSIKKTGTVSLLGSILAILIIYGSVLVLKNRIEGRSFFIPAAIIQLLGLSLLALFSLLGGVANAFMWLFLGPFALAAEQDEMGVLSFLSLSGLSAFGAIYLLIGVFTLPLGVRKIDKFS